MDESFKGFNQLSNSAYITETDTDNVENMEYVSIEAIAEDLYL